MSGSGSTICIVMTIAMGALTGLPSHAQQPGQALYQSNCARCHGLDARGGEHAPDIATAQAVQQLTDGELLRILRDGIPAGGMPAFGSHFTGEQLSSIASYLRSLQGQRETGPVPGKPEFGENLFFHNAGCSECHMAQGKGGFIASDLSSYAATHSVSEMREAILNPNENLDLRRTVATAITQNGQRYTGIIRNEDNFSLQLESRDGVFHLFDKSALTSITHEKKSLMPADYKARLTPTELDNIISYLVHVAAGEPKPAQEPPE
jgi:cytochrome c oxidase cbb3-type subunit III